MPARHAGSRPTARCWRRRAGWRCGWGSGRASRRWWTWRDSIRGEAAIHDLRDMTALAQKALMDRFVAIAEGLDVAPALAELERAPEYWVNLNMDAQDYVPLLGSSN